MVKFKKRLGNRDNLNKKSLIYLMKLLI